MTGQVFLQTVETELIMANCCHYNI